LKLEDQVCSLDLAKRLKELGVKQESLVYWWDGYQGYGYDAEKKWGPRPIERTEVSFQAPDRSLFWDKNSSAFTVAELGEMLPAYLENNGDRYWPDVWKNDGKEWAANLRNWDAGKSLFEGYLYADNEANIRAKLLVRLIKRELVKP
jgi:hypothetical protein